MNVLALLRERFGRALTGLGIDAADLPGLLALVLPSQDAKFGDYQANCAMPLGKKLGKPPREIAAQLVAGLDIGEFCEPPEIAGPGFINVKFKDEWLRAQLAEMVADGDRLGVAKASAPRTIVVDYSSPNVAKPMHVGHIRSTVIGDALNRILKFLGHRTISDNHLGDWGTQFGMIIYGVKHFGDRATVAKKGVEELTRLYKLVNSLVEYQEALREKIPAVEQKIAEAEKHAAEKSDEKDPKKEAKRLRQAESQVSALRAELAGLKSKVAVVDEDPELSQLAAAHSDIGKQVLLETARLHAGDPTNIELWREILPSCLAEIEVMYKRLGVTFDNTLGESFYHDRLQGVVTDLEAKGLARKSDGAVCVFLEGNDVPMIVQKQDGAFLYSTSDLATIQYRMSEWRPDAILYVVDHRQSLHFEHLFAVARLWGYPNVELQHIGFGTVLGDDGRPFKTRSGKSVVLSGLLDEAVERAYAIVSQNDDGRPQPMLSEADRKNVAERVGIGGIKYADLAHNRTSDYVFNYDKMLATTGNTAAYMQYSYARVRSIFAKGGLDESTIRTSKSEILLSTPQERALAMSLLQFSETLDRVVADYRPNSLTAYLFELATRFSDFFQNCPVLQAETDELKTSRLILCDLTSRTIKLGLNLLGIEVVERM
jgi:arginyl-tRNA synthetase